MKRIVVGSVLALTFSLGLGCNKGPEMAQVTGTVLYEGEPLPHGTISFELPGGLFAHGEIENGQILNVRDSRSGAGVAVGKAGVSITSIEAVNSPSKPVGAASETGGGTEGMPLEGRDLIPVKYSNPATSGLTAEIQPGKNELSFTLTKS